MENIRKILYYKLLFYKFSLRFCKYEFELTSYSRELPNRLFYEYYANLLLDKSNSRFYN